MNQLISEIIKLDDSYFTSLLQDNSVPGMAVGIFDKSTQYYRTFGFAKHQQVVDPDTSFRVASLTKPVFSYLFHQLVAENIYDLDTPVIEYYKDRYVDDDRIEDLTARHILSHQSGFPNWSWNSPLSFEFVPGTKFSYSGEGFMYLQNMIEKHQQTEVHRLIRKYILDPMDLKHTELYDQLLRTENRCLPHDTEGKISQPKLKLTPDAIDYIGRMSRYGNVAGTMWSSIRDYTKFLHHLVHDESNSDILRIMTERQVDIGENGLGWGLGIGLDRISNQEIMWHWGSDQGFKSFTFTFVDEGMGMTVFTNGENGAKVYETIIKDIIDVPPHYITDKLGS